MRPACYTLIICLFLTAPATVVDAQGLFSIFGNKRDEDKVYTDAQLADIENEASRAFESARAHEAAGRTKKAIDSYKSVARSYPNTKVGAEAQFRVAHLYDRDGDGEKAFEQYKTLINKYRSSPRFQTAIERQFAIAESLKNSDKKGFLGIGGAIPMSDLRKMFEQIAASAPYTHFAPRSLMAIAELDVRDGLTASAIRNYQSVVDNYRGTPFAKDAQYQIFKLRGETAEVSKSPSEDRAQVDAGLDFIAQNPDDQRAQDVKMKLAEIEERSLAKMFQTGQFYEESGNHKSAIVYYREIAKKPDSKYYQQAINRISQIERILAGEAIEEKASRFGPLPSLNIKAPKFRIGKDSDEVEPLPVAPTPPPAPADAATAAQ